MDTQAPATRGSIDIISDVICPWCYIGKRHLETALPLLAAEGLNFDVRWHAYQLNPDMPVEGVDRAEYRRQKFGADPERVAAMDKRVADAGAAVGITFRHDLMLRTPNTIAAHRVVWLAGQHGVQDAVVEGLFRGYFTEGRDVGDRATLIEIAEANGLDRRLTTAMLAGDEGRREVVSEDEMARRAGLDGVPTFTMHGHILFSGAVPGDTMAEAFAKAWKVLSKQAA